MVVSATGEARAAGLTEPGFCKGKIARDYLRPLRHMPVVRHLPRSGRLPFGPRRLDVHPLGPRLQVGAGYIGYAFSDGANGQPRRLDWRISVRLLKMSPRGFAKGTPKVKRRYVGTVKNGEIDGLWFAVSEKPAFYRIDISFKAKSGKPLGTYSAYFRVVPLRFRVRLGASARIVRPGRVIYARVVNLGTQRAGYGTEFSIERFDGVGWSLDPASPMGPWRRLKVGLAGGRAGDCMRFRVPVGQPAGRYRFSKKVSGNTGAKGWQSRTLVAVFRVI